MMASCPTRELTDVELITPKEGVPYVAFGFENCGWFIALKNSARNWRVLSGRRKPAFRMTAKSKFDCPGPFTIPVELLPNALPIPSEPMTGGVVKHGALK
jgi:hypothetical protein